MRSAPALALRLAAVAAVAAVAAFAAIAAIALLAALARPAAAAVYEVRPGEDLAAGLRALGPGDEVIVHEGTYAAPGDAELVWAGTAAAPIVVRGAPGARPVIAGAPGAAVLAVTGSYFTLRDLALAGGAVGVRLAGVDHATLAELALLDPAVAGVACDVPGRDCTFVTIRRCEVRGGDTGLALGCAGAACRFRDAAIDSNYVHDLAGPRGVGIEVRAGAAGVVVRDNVVVRARTAGIAVSAFAGNAAPNAVERNLVWSTLDSGILVAGRVRVRGNIVLGAAVHGILSQAADGFFPGDVELVNNTVAGAGAACLRARDWAAPPALAAGQLVANNALYCEGAAAIDLAGGAPAARLVANVGRGDSNAPAGFALGRSAAEDLTDLARADVYPRADSPLAGAGSGALAPRTDFDGCGRGGATVDVGAYERGPRGAPFWALAEAPKPVASCGERPGGSGSAGDDEDADGGGCCSAGGAHPAGSAALAALTALAALAALRRPGGPRRPRRRRRPTGPRGRGRGRWRRACPRARACRS